MAGFRAYFDFSKNIAQNVGDEITLSQDESRHLCGSLRAKVGEEIDAFDLAGNVKHCEIISDTPKRAVLKILDSIEIPHRDVEVYIAQCLPKGKTFDDIIRQAVEIGATGIIPIMSARSQVKIDDKEKSKKLEKWNVHIIEAIKQSANFFKFDLLEPMSFEDFLKISNENFDLKIVASLQDNSQPIAKILKQSPNAKKICILIGPEGDLSLEEYSLANSANFSPATLGKNVMKCDTAAIFALSAVISQTDS